MTEIQVPATRGEPYTITRDGGLIRLKRVTATGRSVTVVFGRADVIAVSNALVDILETGQ